MLRLFLVFFSLALWAKPLDVDVSAPQAILINADSGAVLFEKNPHQPTYPASLTKIATALYILDQKRPPLEQFFAVPEGALQMRKGEESPPHYLEKEGSRMGIRKGEILTVEALLHGLLLVSGNDAANALALCLAPSVAEFMGEVNEYLREIGCLSTQFLNPHGLHHPEHFTTAYDLALMAKKGLALPQFCQIVSKLSYRVPQTNKQNAKELVQHNQLLLKGPLHYPFAFGIKTGYTSYAMHTLVTAAERGGRRLIAVLLGCKKREDRYKDAVRLFEAAFQEALRERVFIAKATRFERHLLGAKTPLIAELKEAVALSFYPSEEPACKAFIHWEEPLLPIRAGQTVGCVRLIDDKGRLLQERELVAMAEVKPTFWTWLKGLY